MEIREENINTGIYNYKLANLIIKSLVDCQMFKTIERARCFFGFKDDNEFFMDKDFDTRIPKQLCLCLYRDAMREPNSILYFEIAENPVLMVGLGLCGGIKKETLIRRHGEDAVNEAIGTPLDPIKTFLNKSNKEKLSKTVSDTEREYKDYISNNVDKDKIDWKAFQDFVKELNDRRDRVEEQCKHIFE